MFTGTEGASTKFDTSKIVILPVPYDKTSTWVKGADKGPLAILEASVQLEMYDIETGTVPAEYGIFTAPDVNCRTMSPEKMTKLVKKEVSKLISDKKFVVVL
ncbi:MAG: arginase family protein, partial [Candidatus Omnitrophica bacterium]|nr:arginase family protein [Candidatus Omnitrophota bacterium]